MMKAERQELILKRVADSGRVVVTDLAKEMGVTETTLRKDLQELDDRGAVQRVHGGAIKPDTELSRFENRVDLGADVKKRLAELAMDEIDHRHHAHTHRMRPCHELHAGNAVAGHGNRMHAHAGIPVPPRRLPAGHAGGHPYSQRATGTPVFPDD